MNMTSKTGLLASPRKRVIRFNRTPDLSTLCAITKQADFSLRPFGGLYNPYSFSCSILCNHPATLEMKNVVKQAKEGKTFTLKENLPGKNREILENNETDLPEHVPEEFFRRYTDTDSRPLTPTPTIASGRTRESRTGSLLNARRCVTPEPTTGSYTKERKQLILDLRRSHSQETLYWNASSELSPGPTQEQWTQQSISESPQKQESEKISVIKSEIEPIQKEDSLICINALSEDDDDEPRRRGKKRKKPKTSGVSSFTATQDPETQVATLLDSPNQSARQSLIPNCVEPPINTFKSKFKQLNIVNTMKHSSCFLDDDSLKILRRGLNLDVVENMFERYMNRALKEAYRTIPQDKLQFDSDVVKELKGNLNLPEIDHEKWIKLPRKYSRLSARFEIPLDSNELNMMNPLEYLSKYVSVSKTQKQIYRRIFLRNLTQEPPMEEKPQQTEEEDEDNVDVPGEECQQNQNEIPIEERLMKGNVVDIAMIQALGFHATLEKIQEIREILEMTEDSIGLNFRTWCGILAFSERYLIKLEREIDPCNEIETADFESLERRLNSVTITKNFEKVLYTIKNN